MNTSFICILYNVFDVGWGYGIDVLLHVTLLLLCCLEAVSVSKTLVV